MEGDPVAAWGPAVAAAMLAAQGGPSGAARRLTGSAPTRAAPTRTSAGARLAIGVRCATMCQLHHSFISPQLCRMPCISTFRAASEHFNAAKCHASQCNAALMHVEYKKATVDIIATFDIVMRAP